MVIIIRAPPRLLPLKQATTRPDPAGGRQVKLLRVVRPASLSELLVNQSFFHRVDEPRKVAEGSFSVTSCRRGHICAQSPARSPPRAGRWHDAASGLRGNPGPGAPPSGGL